MSLHNYLKLGYENNVTGRYNKQAGQVIKFLAKQPEAETITVIAKGVKASIPTVTKLVNDLIDQGYVIEEGKRATESFGRKPSIYALNREKFYVVGVSINLKKIQLYIYDISLQPVFEVIDDTFVLSDTLECRADVLQFMENEIANSGVDKQNILGVGVTLTGRVNGLTGQSFNYLSKGDESIADYLRKKLELHVFIDNDTRAIGLAEQYFYKDQDLTNALIINIGRGIGMSIVANNKLVSGGDGFAGEFGHMQFAGNKGSLCICGKRGCLDTEVSGKALEEMYNLAIDRGEKSTCEISDKKSIHYSDIIEAANKGDGLSIFLLQQQGKVLGEALGNVINLLNPQCIIVSGRYGRVGDYFLNAIQSGLYLSALSSLLPQCKVISSSVRSDIETVGAGSLVLKRLEMI
ncbi:ROK family protein [Carboxylicivirga taeanensis]|uniref:ROK family protein n=1 Tax=Carboxylicivirga taeanensis TaxID=1416875 RepID=UPI003F6E1D96